MARRNVKDKDGQDLGAIDDQPKQAIAYDANGKRIGRFDKKQNKTFDAAGKLVGTGNKLNQLLHS